MKSMRTHAKPAVMLDTMAAPSMPPPPEYPYGLRVTLEKDQVMILGMHDAAVDDEVTITAKAKVCGVHKSESYTAGMDNYQHSVDLQITHMDVGKKS